MTGLPVVAPFRPLPWTQEALCQSHPNPDLWFGEQGAQHHAAKAFCSACPVQAECLDYAMRYPTMLLGVWGGLSAIERESLRRRNKRQATA